MYMTKELTTETKAMDPKILKNQIQTRDIFVSTYINASIKNGYPIKNSLVLGLTYNIDSKNSLI